MGVRGIRKHLKRINTPKHWCLDKLSGVFAPRPTCGPHKLRECLPLQVLLRDRLKYALNGKEVLSIVKQRLIKIDGKVRTDKTYPCGFMDVISIEKTKEHFRMLFDTKGRFVPLRISKEEGDYKLCRVRKTFLGKKAIHYAVTHDGRTIRFVMPDVKVADTLRFCLKTGTILDHLPFKTGMMATVIGGHNVGRTGIIKGTEKHPGSFEIIHLEDAHGISFATTKKNVFCIGTADKAWVSLPKGEGVRLNIIDDRKAQIAKLAAEKGIMDEQM